MSVLRPTLVSAVGKPHLDYRSTYFRVLQAVNERRALIHGRLEDAQGQTCAIGSYFRRSNMAIDSRAIDEIAAYNDSFPHLSPQDRWRKVVAWLRWRTRRI